MPKIQLVTNVADYGLLRPLARTRGRLVVSTLVATALAFGLGLWSAHYVLEVSASVVLNLLLITLNMMVMLVAAYLQAVLVGDLFFRGPWREAVILGERRDDAPVRNYNAEFMVVLLIAVVANPVALNKATGGFMDAYHDEGFFRVRLRSDDAAERLAAMADLTDPMNFELWPRPALQDAVVDHLDDPDAEVRAYAAWNAGEMEVDPARDALIRLASDADQPAAVRAEAAQSLGKLGNVTEAREALQEMARLDDDPAVVIGALRGLALMASPLSVDAVLPLVESEQMEIRVHAYYALRSIQDPEIRPMLLARLEAEGLPKLERCAVLDTLKMVATPDDVTWARRQFTRESAEDRCERVVWEERNERLHYVVYEDSFREKLLKIVANGDGVNNAGWFRRLVQDPQQTWRIREVANEVVKQIDEAQR